MALATATRNKSPAHPSPRTSTPARTAGRGASRATRSATSSASAGRSAGFFASRSPNNPRQSGGSRFGHGSGNSGAAERCAVSRSVSPCFSVV